MQPILYKKYSMLLHFDPSTQSNIFYINFNQCKLCDCIYKKWSYSLQTSIEKSWFKLFKML